MRTLYGAPLSPFVRKVAIFLEEKGLSYEWKMLRPQSDEIRALNPLGKIPVYEEDGFVIADSSVICAYIERTHPSPALYPQDAKKYAQALWFEEYFDGAMIRPMRVIYREGYSNQKFFGKAKDDAEYGKAAAELGEMFAYLESRLPAGGWLLGEFSIADISIAVGFGNTHLAGYALDADKYPKLANLLARASARPSFRHVAKKMDEFVASL